MKNIAVICRNMGGSGSVANVAMRQARELALSLDVVVVSDTFPPNDGKDRGPKLLPVEPRSFLYLRRFAHVPNELAFLLAARKCLLGHLKQNRLDAVICHSHASSVFVGRKLQQAGVRVIMITHGDIFDRPRGTYDSRLTAFYRYVTPIAYRMADCTVALSPYMRELAIRNGAEPEKTVVIPHGVDPVEIGLEPDWEYVRPPDTPDCLKILFAGRLSVEKDPATLVRACSLLKSRNQVFALKLVGDGPLRQELENLVRDDGLEKFVEFSGAQARKRMASNYLWADVVCVVSKSEALGLTVLEAMFCGRPVIGTDTGGIRSLVDDTETGFLVPVGDEGVLANRLENMVVKKSALAPLGRIAVQRAGSRYTWSRNAQSMRRLLQELADRR